MQKAQIRYKHRARKKTLWLYIFFVRVEVKQLEWNNCINSCNDTMHLNWIASTCLFLTIFFPFALSFCLLSCDTATTMQLLLLNFLSFSYTMFFFLPYRLCTRVFFLSIVVLFLLSIHHICCWYSAIYSVYIH